MPEGLVTSDQFVHIVQPREKEKGGNMGEGKKGSRIYVRKERSKTAKVQWHLRYLVRASD